MDQDVRALVDKQAITEVVYRYARGIDRMDAETVASCYHDDATDDHGVFMGSASEFVAWVMPVLATMERTMHFIGNVLIDLEGERARVESYFIAHHVIAAPEGKLHTIAAGRYFDRMEKRAGAWRIAHRQAVYDWSRRDASTDTWDGPGAMPPSFKRGARGRADNAFAFGISP